MGYFANGSAGADYEQQWCARCLHGDGDSAGDCAVWEAHLLKNYDQTAKPVLDVLIPRDGIGNARCRLFVRGGQRRLRF